MFQGYLSNKATHLFQSWKTWGSISLVLAMLSVLASPTSAAGKKVQNQNKALPVFDINKTEHNFGDVFIGEEIIARFTVRNLGAAPLLLSELPIAPGAPTVGLYREPQPASKQSVKDLVKPAGLGKGALPYT